jgi:dienelactone hydrolase
VSLRRGAASSVLVLVSLWGDISTGATLSGHWEGTAAIPAMQMRIAIDMESKDGAVSAILDLPEIGEAHIPITRVIVDEPDVRLVLETPIGTDVISLRLQGDQLQGNWASVLAPDTALIVLQRAVARTALYQEEEVTFSNDAIELSGTLLVPTSATEHPAIVFVHGSGPETRHASRFMAEQFAKAGVAALIYDKRGAGASQGDWTRSNFDDLAGDVIAAVNLLEARPDIDPARIGLRGQSQGGWIVPLAATQTDRIAAVITISGSLTTPALQGHWNMEYALIAGGYSEDEIEQAELVLEAKDDATRTGDWTGFRRAVGAVGDEPWFEIAGINPDPDTTSWFWPWYRTIMDFDPLPVYRELSVPMLAVLGENDEYVSSERSQRVLAGIRDELGKPISIRVYDDADHNLRIQSKPGEPFRWGVFADGYVAAQIDWFLETIRAH